MMSESIPGDTPAQPVVCTLTPDEVDDQLASWEELHGAVRHVAIDERGATLWFDAAASEAVRAVVEREAACCTFLSLRRSLDRASVRVDIEAGTQEGVAVAQMLAALVSRETS